MHDDSPRIRRPAVGEDALLRTLTSRRSGEYDCVVPLSGGKDSSYALFFVARDLGLKPLAVFADSGLAVDAAKKNIERICGQLSVDLVVHQARFRRRLAREALYIT
jgi:tRNA(Ile)-lysidine synthase TilS/MesJ